jgi:hypothetical protein
MVRLLLGKWVANPSAPNDDVEGGQNPPALFLMNTILQDLFKGIVRRKSCCPVCGSEMNFLELVFWPAETPEDSWPMNLPFCPTCDPVELSRATVQ